VTFAEPKIDVEKLRGFKQGVVDFFLMDQL